MCHIFENDMTQGYQIHTMMADELKVMTITKTHAKTKTNTKWLKGPTYAIFSKMLWLKDIKYDGSRWTEGDDNDKDTRKDKDAMTKRPHMCHIFENDTTQGYQIRWWQNRQIHQNHHIHHIYQNHQNHISQFSSTFINFAQPNTAFDTEFAQFAEV